MHNVAPLCMVIETPHSYPPLRGRHCSIMPSKYQVKQWCETNAAFIGMKPGGGVIPRIQAAAKQRINNMAEFLFRGYETALRLHTPEAALASYPGHGGASIIYLMN